MRILGNRYWGNRFELGWGKEEEAAGYWTVTSIVACTYHQTLVIKWRRMKLAGHVAHMGVKKNVTGYW